MRAKLLVRNASEENSMSESTSTVKSESSEWIFVILSAWLIAGIFVDGWAHNHLARLETFFTPWHAVLYSGMLAIAGYLIVTAKRNHDRSVSWWEALPPGYGLSLCGVVVFFIGGLADMTWHIFFGIEKNVEALLSPTHLILVFGATWIVGGPLRAALRRSFSRTMENSKKLFPAIISLAYILSLLTFFTQFASPIVHSWADVQTIEPLQQLGIASILLQSAIEMGVVLFLVLQWEVPLGTFALVFAMKNGLSAILANNTLPVIIGATLFAALIGFIIDGLNKWLRPSLERRSMLILFAFLTPVIDQSAYFLATELLHGVVWSINLWLGSIVMSGIVGVLLSYLMVAQVREAR